eukprot:3365360-Karenia_brevis.AAC.1
MLRWASHDKALKKNQRQGLAAQKQKDTISTLRSQIAALEAKLVVATPVVLNADAAPFVPSQ